MFAIIPHKIGHNEKYQEKHVKKAYYFISSTASLSSWKPWKCWSEQTTNISCDGLMDLSFKYVLYTADIV